MNQNDLIQWTGLIIAIIALVVSLIALVYTVLTYLLKSGHKIRCNYETASSIDSEDPFISSLTLENLKDRATVVFAIYLRIGNNNFLEIEDFENSPLILKPFEVYHKNYGPVLLYSEGVDRFKLNRLINDEKVKKQVIISTTDGKFVVRTNHKRWSTTSTFFTNYFTAIARPVRLYYKDIAYGSRVKFLVIFKNQNREEQVVPLYNESHQVKTFRNFALTQESLSTKENLDAFLRSQRDQKRIAFDDLEVLSISEKIEEIKSGFKQTRDAEALGYLKYHVLGRRHTLRANRTLKHENEMRQSKVQLREADDSSIQPDPAQIKD